MLIARNQFEIDFDRHELRIQFEQADYIGNGGSLVDLSWLIVNNDVHTDYRKSGRWQTLSLRATRFHRQPGERVQSSLTGLETEKTLRYRSVLCN